MRICRAFLHCPQYQTSVSTKILVIGVLYILICSFKYCEAHEIDGIVKNFIADVTDSLYHGSFSVTAILCTNEDEIKEFSQFLSKNHKLHTILTFQKDQKLDLRPFEYMFTHRNFHVLDLDCPGSHQLLIEADNNQMFAAPRKWLILQDLRKLQDPMINDSESSSTQLKDIFGNLQIFPDSEVTIGQRIDDNFVRLISVYRPNRVGNLIFEGRGIWTDEDGLKRRDGDESSRRRTDVLQTQLKAAVVVTSPSTIHHLEDFKEKETDAISKVCYPLTKLLADRMNATVDFIFTPSWGYQSANGSWDGMIGALVRDEVDLGGTAIYITEPRLSRVGYMNLYIPTRVRFVFRRPPLSYVSNLFILPFARNVWIAAGLFCGLGFTILYLSMRQEWEEVKKLRSDERLWGDLERKPAFGDNFLIVIGAITQQGSAYEPRTTPARAVIFMLLVLCLSLYAAYTANIVALLQSSSDSIKNVEDLMESPLQLGLHDIVYNRYYMGKFEDPLRKEFYERRIKDQKNIYMTLEEGMERVRTGLFAFQTDLTMAYAAVKSTYAEDEKCGFEEIDYMYSSDPTFVIKRRSPYAEIFRVGGLWLEETGLAQRFIDKMYNRKPPCNNQQKFISVGTIDCYAAYLVIAYGIGLTFLIFLCEVFWSKKFDGRSSGIIDEQNQDAGVGSASDGGQNIGEELMT